MRESTLEGRDLEGATLPKARLGFRPYGRGVLAHCMGGSEQPRAVAVLSLGRQEATPGVAGRWAGGGRHPVGNKLG